MLVSDAHAPETVVCGHSLASTYSRVIAHGARDEKSDVQALAHCRPSNHHPLVPSSPLTFSRDIITHRDRIRTAVNVLSDGYVSGIVAHLSKDELARYDAEHARHPELDRVETQSK